MATKKTMPTRKTKKNTRKSPEKKVARRERGAGVNKSAFIRQQPETMSARDVVEAAAAEGITLTESFVYNVRSNAKSKARNGQTGKSGPARVSGRSLERTDSQDESTFRGLVIAVGTNRANELIAEVEAKLTAVIEGK